MAGDLAILACDGALPVEIAHAYPQALQITLAGVPHRMGPGTQEHRIERLGDLFAALKAAGIKRLVFAGALTRPVLKPEKFDQTMMALAPRLLAAMQNGDDVLLREAIEIFEEQGVTVIGPHELLPDLIAPQGMRVGVDPSADDLSDVARACDILKAVSPLDIGQGCVVAGGQCLGVETLQGTDALLDFVSKTPASLRPGPKGVFVKAAKQGQDLRIDMPTIGPQTIDAVAQAGLAGLVIEAGKVMLLDRAVTLQRVVDNGIFLFARVM